MEHLQVDQHRPYGIPNGEDIEKGPGILFKEIIAKNVPNMGRK